MVTVEFFKEQLQHLDHELFLARICGSWFFRGLDWIFDTHFFFFHRWRREWHLRLSWHFLGRPIVALGWLAISHLHLLRCLRCCLAQSRSLPALGGNWLIDDFKRCVFLINLNRLLDSIQLASLIRPSTLHRVRGLSEKCVEVRRGSFCCDSLPLTQLLNKSSCCLLVSPFADAATILHLYDRFTVEIMFLFAEIRVSLRQFSDFELSI